MNRTIKYIIALFIILDLILLVCLVKRQVRGLSWAAAQEQTEEAETKQPEVESVAVAEAKEFSDDASLYNYDLSQIDCFYITVLEGTESEGINHTFTEVSSYKGADSAKEKPHYAANTLLQIGNEEGIVEGKLGYSAKTANSSIRVYEDENLTEAIKSYQIDLFYDEEGWNGQQKIVLRKHMADPLRVRNSVYYDLMRRVPGLTSNRTHFVHVFFCDRTASGDGSGRYVDYGIFTAEEPVDESYFENHHIGNGGELYQAAQFEFGRNPEVIRRASDPAYDPQAFEKILKPVGEIEDHEKLITMLDAVNDQATPIETTVDRYFDPDNLMDYMAFNIVMGVSGAATTDYYLYSPYNSEKWYLLCGNGAEILKEGENSYLYPSALAREDWSKGISMYSVNELFRRMICRKEYREMLTKRVEAMLSLYTADQVKETFDSLSTPLEPHLSVNPDKRFLGVKEQQYRTLREIVPKDMNLNSDEYTESLKKPLPFYTSVSVESSGKLSFNWEEAYDFNGEFVTYDIQVATDPSMDKSKLVADATVMSLSYVTNMLAPGEYYYRIVATNTTGYSRISFDRYVTEDACYEGVCKFSVGSDGSVVMK